MMPVITDKVRQHIADAMKHAELHPLVPADLLKSDPRWKNTVHIKPGFVAVYTIEKQDQTVLRHLSVRVQVDQSVVHPSDEALTAIMLAFGYDRPLESYVRAQGPYAKHVIEEVSIS